jgi:hypothetical protein
MIRNLKVFGLSIIAILALSSVAASMASADKFTVESSPATLTANQVEANVFTTTAGTVKCTTTTFKGTVNVVSTTEVTVAPTYGGCTGFGFPAHVDVNECVYVLTINPAAGVTTGTVDVECPAGKEITVTATTSSVNPTLKCTVHVPTQTDVGVVTYKNVGTPPGGETREVLVEVNLAGLKYTHTAGSGLGACPSGSSSTGTYKGTVLVTGENAAGTTHIGVFVD